MEHLRELRKAKGLTMKQLGSMVDATESMIQMLETGTRKPSFELLLKLGEALDCSVDELINGKKNPTTANGDGNDALFTEMYSNFNQLPPKDREYIVGLINWLLNKGD